MTVVVHLIVFAFAALVIWLAAGRLIEVVDGLARRFRRSGFTVAFFVLGFLTSISELSVMVNSTLTGEPQVSAGNLAGASVSLLLFLVPLTAIIAGGIRLDQALNQQQRALALIAAALPAFAMADGNASLFEGFVCLLVYGMLLMFVRRRRAVSVSVEVESIVQDVLEETTDEGVQGSPIIELAQVAGGAIAIFLAGNLLVEETVYFSDKLDVPSSVVGLVVLSFGTNLPEMVIAVRAVRQGKTGIAFGNYIGSSLTNTMLFGLLVLLNGGFDVEGSEFVFASAIMAVGFTAFFIFARSQNRITRVEGWCLFLIYLLFVTGQIAYAARY